MSLRDAMNLFDLLFPLVMIAFPAVLAAFVRFKPGGADDEARRRAVTRLSVALWVATAAAALLVVAAWAAGWVWASRFAWVLFFPLYFGLAWPLSRAKDPAWGDRPRPAARAARLSPRHDPPPAPWPVFAAGVALWAVAVIVTAAVLLESGRPQALAMLALPLGGGFWLAAAGFSYRATFREAEPLPPHPAPELERAYDEFRLWLRRCFFWFGLVAAGVFAAAGLLGAFAAREALPGWVVGLIGGGAGAALGIAGGVFGTIGTLKRVRLNRLYRDSLAAGPPAGVA